MTDNKFFFLPTSVFSELKLGVLIIGFIAGLNFLFSCSSLHTKKNHDSLKAQQTMGYIVPADSVKPPEQLIVYSSRVIVSGKPNTITVPDCCKGQLFTRFPEKIGLEDDQTKTIGGISALFIARSITADKKGTLWFATIGGVSCYDGETLTYYTEKEGLCNNVVDDILEDRNGTMWFSTGNGKISTYDGNSFSNSRLGTNAVLCMYEDKAGNIWFSGYDGVRRYDGMNYTLYTKKQGLSENSVYSMLEDKNGNIWFATWGGGATCYNGKTFIHFTTANGLCNNKVWSMLEDKNGNIWFGSYGSGISCYNGKVFQSITTTSGLVNDTVNSIFQDRAGNLWFGTENGLSEISAEHLRELQDSNKNFYPLKKNMFRNYGNHDGFKGACCTNAVGEDSKGNIWWGTSDGLICFHP
ncbi:MAG TPA: two-component regulator propeller domain-containing protein [Bacteroidia bacterium]|nr:two-component regulator propeller domain-containing protein [Bacteroidia bacterium]